LPGRGWALVGDAGYYKDRSARTDSPTRFATPSCSRAIIAALLEETDERDAFADYQAIRDVP